MGLFPVDVRDYVKTGKQVEEKRDEPVRIAIFVEPDAPDALVSAVEREFRPYTANALLHVEVAEPGTILTVDSSSDVVIALVGSGRTGIAEQIQRARERAIPTVAMALAESSAAVADTIKHPYRDTIAHPDPVELIEDDLGEWLVERVPDKRLAMASNFRFMRRAVAVEAVKNTAWQNGVVGVVAFFPGADMPLMTANQGKMVLQIAAAYGEPIGVERLRELAAVIGGAFVLRTAARQVASFIPGFGWAVKGAIGASGTLAMGFAAIEFFERDLDLAGVSRSYDKLKARLGEIGSGEAEQEVIDLGEVPGVPPALAETPDPAQPAEGPAVSEG
jgi:uncharacterized protein (DUF697 family)/ribosomal protein S9